MSLELTRLVYKQEGFESLEDFATALFEESENNGFCYDFECVYNNVVISLSWEDFQNCEFRKESVVRFIVDKYKNSI